MADTNRCNLADALLQVIVTTEYEPANAEAIVGHLTARLLKAVNPDQVDDFALILNDRAWELDRTGHPRAKKIAVMLRETAKNLNKRRSIGESIGIPGPASADLKPGSPEDWLGLHT